MAELVVEIHVPLTPAPGRGRGPNDYACPWIDDIDAYLAELDGSHGEMYDDGEEVGRECLFFVSGAPEAELIQLAKRVSQLRAVPTGRTPSSTTPRATWAMDDASTCNDPGRDVVAPRHRSSRCLDERADGAADRVSAPSTRNAPCPRRSAT